MGGMHQAGMGRELRSRWVGITTSAQFDDDWIITHEMVHLAFPSVAEKHHWIEEGLATYVEPVARARVGQLIARKDLGRHGRGDAATASPNAAIVVWIRHRLGGVLIGEEPCSAFMRMSRSAAAHTIKRV